MNTAWASLRPGGKPTMLSWHPRTCDPSVERARA